ncbi:type II toxin-antitoxin system HicA family toxin [Corynebacterium glucuronolyticum]|uniref:type II toxin-antitoxin system HicA family toxin n=1 Tax=Corynebacterium glucuronolyticum TaxID=39791 RepID=UPI00223AF312|nr:type II toxin-antitoxin system HicA family toxin [Corynebacterium glucuronolyticum]
MRVTELTKILAARGATMIRQRGSHQRWKASRDGITAYTTVAMHSGDIPQGTLRQIEQQMEPVLGKGWLR